MMTFSNPSICYLFPNAARLTRKEKEKNSLDVKNEV